VARTPRLVTALTIAGSALIGAPEASGAVTVGGDLQPAPSGNGLGCADPSCAWANTTLPGEVLTSPVSGVVVRWRARVTNVGIDGTKIRLQVIRAAGSGAFTGVSVSETESLALSGADIVHLFPTRQSITAGDQLALHADPPGVGSLAITAPTVPGVTQLRWGPALGIGETRAPTNTFLNDAELLINADVEPDADCDGFGDETQDPLVSGGCLPAKAAALSGGTAKTKGKQVPLQISCAAAGGNCEGNSIALATTKRVSLAGPRTSAAKGKRINLGGASFSVPAGGTAIVVVPLTKAGRKLFRTRAKAGATATISGGGQTSAAAVTIKRTGKKKRR
jgi:hypothetical protein